MKKIAIKIDNLTVKYKGIEKFSVKKALLKKGFKRANEFEALTDISFQVEEGQIIGVIGSNGSGKSTLLKAIAGIFCPDEGSIDLCNNSVSLQAIGVGFQYKLSGRENIYLSGLLLGFSWEEIENNIENIIEFSGIREFIDKPVNSYSSGMQSKLAFSITAILETDIILIDEVLSVGDTKFKKKSYNKMKELILNDKRTVIIVSHNMETLKKLCDEIIWIEKGEMIKHGDSTKIIDEYLEKNR